MRRLIAQRKRQCCDSTLEALSSKIFERLETCEAFKEARTVLLYYSLKDEPDTHAFIEKWSKEIKILLPVICGDELELRVYRGRENLTTGTYGIKEPLGEPFTDYASIDLAVIPGVAFDRSGNRLGRGKGYYDKLLQHITAYKIGVCFPFQQVEEIPAEEFDIRMDEVISC